MKSILITGAAGFIGSALTKKLLSEEKEYVLYGIDNLNDYYDVSLKEYRLNRLRDAAANSRSAFVFIKGDISDRETITKLFSEAKPDVVVHLAAQAGVRYSIENPDAYIKSNLLGFYEILEAARHSAEKGNAVKHLVFASSSSVYGGNTKVPFSVEDNVDHPVSLYAATKKSNELLAYSYAKLYNLPSTGLRFFTVYGPAGRPDMAYFSFTERLRKKEKIRIFNYGKMKRDFTYIDDIVEGIFRVMQRPPAQKTGEDGLPIAPYALYNIGNSQPVELMDFVRILYGALKNEGILDGGKDISELCELLPMQPGDVPCTYADVSPLTRDFGFRPDTSLADGLKSFARWYKEYL